MNAAERTNIDQLAMYVMSLYTRDVEPSLENSLPLPTPPPTESSITLTAQESDQKDSRTVALLDVPEETKKTLRHIPIAVPKSELSAGHAAWVSYLENSDFTGNGYTVMVGSGVCLFKFKGWCVDGLPTGKGKITFADGEYDGNFKEGLFNGYGLRKFENGDRYEGNFLNGTAHGKGTKYYVNGDHFKGEFEKGIVKEGVFTCNDGKTKSCGVFGEEGLEGEGEIVEYDPHPSLLEETPRVIRYSKGKFMKGLLNGEGMFINGDKDKYTGEFQNGKFHGQGTMNFHDGATYTGSFISGKGSGSGVLKEDEGRRVWKGNFINCQPEGACEFTEFKYPEGTPDNYILNFFKGNFSNGNVIGPGYEIKENGDKYTGTYKEGKVKHGQFVLDSKDGTTWKITYEDGWAINGVVFYRDGKREKVTFNNKGEIATREPITNTSKK